MDSSAHAVLASPASHSAVCLCLDGPMHPEYQHYGPEYYSVPPYPMYHGEHHFDVDHDDYFTSQIHVDTRNSYAFAHVRLLIGTATAIHDLAR